MKMKRKIIGVMSVLFAVLMLCSPVFAPPTWRSNRAYSVGSVTNVSGITGDIVMYEICGGSYLWTNYYWTNLGVWYDPPGDQNRGVEIGIIGAIDAAGTHGLYIYATWFKSGSSGTYPWVAIGRGYLDEEIGLGIWKDGYYWRYYYNLGGGWVNFRTKYFGEDWYGERTTGILEVDSQIYEFEDEMISWGNDVRYQESGGEDWNTNTWGSIMTGIPDTSTHIYGNWFWFRFS